MKRNVTFPLLSHCIVSPKERSKNSIQVEQALLVSTLPCSPHPVTPVIMQNISILTEYTTEDLYCLEMVVVYQSKM